MDDRITPYDEDGNIEDRIDEIVVTAPEDVHFEMMTESSGWLRIGREVFWLHAEKGKMICRHGDTWPA